MYIRTLLLAVSVVAACNPSSTSHREAAAASVSLGLELIDGVGVSEVRYEIARQDMTPMEGVIDTSAPGATPSVEVFGLRPGDGYKVTLSGESSGGETVCKGSESFSIAAVGVTNVMVRLRCTRPSTLGAVNVDGSLSACSELDKVVVSPLETSVGDAITLSASASDADGDAIAFRWFGVGGSVGDPSAADTTFVCESAGAGSVTVEVSDDQFAACIETWEVAITCIAVDCGNCDDQNSCTLDACDEETQACENRPAPAGTPCTDFAPADGFCDGEGQCVINGCASDFDCPAGDGNCLGPSRCDAAGLCSANEPRNEGGPCNTTGCGSGLGICSAGLCLSETPSNECDSAADCPALPGDPCRTPVCEPGNCGRTCEIDLRAGDGNACDAGPLGPGVCEGGRCLAFAECAGPGDFRCTEDDLDPCSVPTCDTSQEPFVCVEVAVDDGLPCFAGATCQQGVCVFPDECLTDQDCPASSNECAPRICDTTGPSNVCRSSTRAADGLACNGQLGTCASGVCVDLCASEEDGTPCGGGAGACASGACKFTNVLAAGSGSTTWVAQTGLGNSPDGCEVFVLAINDIILLDVSVTLTVTSNGAGGVTTAYEVTASNPLLPALADAANYDRLRIPVAFDSALPETRTHTEVAESAGQAIGAFLEGDSLVFATPASITEESANVVATVPVGGTSSVNWSGDLDLRLTLGEVPLGAITEALCTFNVQGQGVEFEVVEAP